MSHRVPVALVEVRWESWLRCDLSSKSTHTDREDISCVSYVQGDCCKPHSRYQLVGGLVAINFIFPEILGFCHHPNWRTVIYFSGRGGPGPPSSQCLTIQMQHCHAMSTAYPHMAHMAIASLDPISTRNQPHLWRGAALFLPLQNVSNTSSTIREMFVQRSEFNIVQPTYSLIANSIPSNHMKLSQIPWKITMLIHFLLLKYPSYSNDLGLLEAWHLCCQTARERSGGGKIPTTRILPRPLEPAVMIVMVVDF